MIASSLRFSVFLLVLVSVIAKAGVQISTLSEKRSLLVLPNYTEADRQTLADQTDFFIRNLFVHRNIKSKDFGPESDPLPKLDEIRAKAKTMTNEELHNALTEVFFSLHDLHTNYQAPAPLGCGAAFIPVRFESVKDGNDTVIVAAKKLKIHAEAVKDISEGDQLLAVDGVEIEKHLATLASHSGGSNPDAMRVRGVEMIGFRSLVSQALPKADSLKLKLKGAKGNYEVEIPWFAALSEDCLDSADAKKAEHKKPEPKIDIKRAMNIAEDDFQKRYNRLFGTPKLVENNDEWRAAGPLDDIFEVAKLQTPGGILGYVKIKAFYWEDQNLDVATVIESFRRVIEGSFQDAVGLILDVRGNPGGYITLAEKLVQLFSEREVDTGKVQMLANSLNETIFLKANGEDNRWSEAIRTAMKAEKAYTSPMAITPHSDANSLGQVWFRPVIVLTDAACFSACDLFTAGMQDSGAGVVIGLHKSTGAGGANVMEYRVFRKIMGPINNPFKPLPFNQNMRVAWRQSIRSGKHAGELLEDKGVESDYVVPLQKADLQLGARELMHRIKSIIDELSPKYVSGSKVGHGHTVVLKNGDVANWKEELYGVDSVELYSEGKLISTLELKSTDEAKEVKFEIPGLSGEWTDHPVVLVGKHNGSQVFRVVRELKWRGDYTEIPATERKLDFSDGKLDLFHAVALRGSADKIWQSVDGHLRVGKGPHYDSNTLTRAFLPLKLEGAGGILTLDIKLNAESENDTLRIYASNPDTGEYLHIFAGSHLSQKTGVNIPLPTQWEKADFVFEFESDENWNMSGPDISNVSISRKPESANSNLMDIFKNLFKPKKPMKG